MPDNPNLFPALGDLVLSKTRVQELPPSVAYWGKGLTIDLSGSQLDSLPASLLSSDTIQCIQIRNTPLAALLKGGIPADAATRTKRTTEKTRYYQLKKRFKIEL